MTALEAIEAVLANAGAPMTVSGITKAILDRGLWRSEARAPEQSVHAVLASDVKRKGPRSRFQRLAPGTYGLSSWSVERGLTAAPPTELHLAVPSPNARRRRPIPEVGDPGQKVTVEGAGLQDAAPNGSRTVLPRLKSQLWSALDLLRGEMEGPEALLHVLGLALYKRISEMWLEEHEARKATASFEFEPNLPDDHHFLVPLGALWQDTWARQDELGECLNRALAELGEANPPLKNVFDCLDFTQRSFSRSLLLRLHKHLDDISLRPSHVSAEVLGLVTEILITQFTEYEGWMGRESYAPRMVCRLVVDCLRPRPGMTVYDPTCGTGGMLLAAAHFNKSDGRNYWRLNLFGQETHPFSLALCQMNLLLHGIDQADILPGDTLRSPKHLRETDAPTLMKFDRVLAHPAFALAQWGYEEWRHGDRYDRDRFGCPSKSSGDLAFLLHAIASLKEDGLAGIVLPQTVLSRRGQDARIIESLLRADLIEAIIGLPPNLFYGTRAETCVLILNGRKARERKGKILFVQGARESRKGSEKNDLAPAHVERIVRAYHEFQNENHFCRVVDVSTIRVASGGLSIDRHVDSPDNVQHRVKSIVDFLQAIDLINQDPRAGTTLFYRGHGSTTFELVPSLYRDGKYVASEDKMYKELIMSNPHDFSDDQSALEKLVRMQHYTLPTRLLDLTLNPLVALYFACQSEQTSADGEIIVLAIPDSEVKFYDSDAVSIVANLAKRPMMDKRQLQRLRQSPEFSQKKYLRVTLEKFNGIVTVERLLHEIREEKSYFLGKINPNDLSRVMCVKAKHNNKRIVAQDGAFLLFALGRQIDKPARVPEAWAIRSKVGAIIVDQNSKVKILEELKRLNIRDSTLFPDIEKTATHVKDKYGP